jgi:hypothetical protein
MFSRYKKNDSSEKMHRAAGATPDANGRAVNFNHFGRRKWTRVDISGR